MLVTKRIPIINISTTTVMNLKPAPFVTIHHTGEQSKVCHNSLKFLFVLLNPYKMLRLRLDRSEKQGYLHSDVSYEYRLQLLMQP